MAEHEVVVVLVEVVLVEVLETPARELTLAHEPHIISPAVRTPLD